MCACERVVRGCVRVCLVARVRVPLFDCAPPPLFTACAPRPPARSPPPPPPPGPPHTDTHTHIHTHTHLQVHGQQRRVPVVGNVHGVGVAVGDAAAGHVPHRLERRLAQQGAPVCVGGGANCGVVGWGWGAHAGRLAAPRGRVRVCVCVCVCVLCVCVCVCVCAHAREVLAAAISRP